MAGDQVMPGHRQQLPSSASLRSEEPSETCRVCFLCWARGLRGVRRLVRRLCCVFSMCYLFLLSSSESRPRHHGARIQRVVGVDRAFSSSWRLVVSGNGGRR